MESLAAFQRRLTTLSTRAERRLAEHGQRRGISPAQLNERHARFHALAAELTRGVVLPRVERLASHIAGARVTAPSRESGDQVLLEIPWTPSAPITARCQVRLAHDAVIEHLLLLVDREFTPTFLRAERSTELRVSLRRVPRARLVDWFEQRLAEFYESYLRVSFVERTQAPVLATDPVCGVRFSKASAAAELEYGGQSFWFVSLAARDRFLREPAHYVYLGGGSAG